METVSSNILGFWEVLEIKSLRAYEMEINKLKSKKVIFI